MVLSTFSPTLVLRRTLSAWRFTAQSLLTPFDFFISGISLKVLPQEACAAAGRECLAHPSYSSLQKVPLLRHPDPVGTTYLPSSIIASFFSFNKNYSYISTLETYSQPRIASALFR